MAMNDFEEVVNMYYEFIKEVFGAKRKVSPKYFFYKEVMHWVNNKRDILLVVKGEDICGFSMCYLDSFNNLTEPVYNAECAYVKPEYRKTRAAYILFKNGYNYAKEKNLNLVTNGRIENGVADMMKKHFKLEEQFINFERINNG